MTVKSIQEAWDEVNKIFPYDYEKNETASKNAGYPIYYSTTSDHQNNWISDLGNRLEVNFEDGRSVNVWVNSEEYHHFEVTNEEYEKIKRIRALERLTKKQYITLNTLVIGFITRWLELVSAFDVISSCIRELEYHQSAVQNKSGVNLPDAAYL